MTVKELVDACVDSVNHPERTRAWDPLVSFTSRGGSPLSKQFFPKFKFMVNGYRGESVYFYSAKELLHAIAANGMMVLDDYAAARKLGMEVKDAEGTDTEVRAA